MDGRQINKNPFGVVELEDSENSPHNSGDSPVSNDKKIASTSSFKRSRRAIQKRVVSVRIKDIEKLKMRGDQMSAPPSDSWAWRKYGQKPIKGSPYPRAYYRCSSSKGCPARKQVERSRVDPEMLVVTYACEHNHPWPAVSRNNHNHHHQKNTMSTPAITTTTTTSDDEELEEEEEEEEEVEVEEEEKKPVIISTNDELLSEYKFGEGPLIIGSHHDQLGWFNDFESTTTCNMLESPILIEDRIDYDDHEIGMINFTMREEDEPLFADLGELPECSTVFRRGIMVQRETGATAA
ncbi:hypothetical protein ACJIZ3_013290 [Penstemon smallii]|uniref:WRKY domain-containing protein n=1 Tax=Penstemon smallii TaxID=265156 RepID=A0ABD3USC6_9LAMI